MTRISRYEPVTLLDEISKIFNEGIAPRSNRDTSNIDTSHWIPAVDIKEEKSQFVILADLPGIEKKDINISMEHNILSIKGERAVESKEEQNGFARVERMRGTFYRRFTLPDTADEKNIQAKMKNGVLEIVIPKKEATISRYIEIKD